jgi:hypothetical protein
MKSETVPPTSVTQTARRWLVLACIMVAYIHNVERWQPTVFFGRPHDDGTYFSTAKALAQGQGYRLVSFPGTPLQTEYPIVYPYLLSWVWKLHPNFPENLKPAIRLTEFFGCWSLIAAFLLLRRYGVGEPAALSLVTLLAFQPAFLHLSGMVMSDVPFMAVLLTTLLLADAATRSRARLPIVLAAGALAGVTVGLRTIGVAVVAGIFFLALRRRAFREAFLLAAVAGSVVAIESWSRLVHLIAGATPSATSAAEPGWNQVLAYYTDYVGFGWKMGIPSAWALVRFLETSVASLALSPGSIIVGVDEGRMAATALLSVLVWLGLLRHLRTPEWRGTWYVLIPYCGIVVAWLPLPERFLLPFLPVFFAALWLETQRLWTMCRTNLRSGVRLWQRALALGFVCVFTSVLGFTGWNYIIGDPRDLQRGSRIQAHALEEKKQAYQWIRDNAGPNDRIAAWEDGLMYLYTGRQGLRPFVPLPQDFYMDDRESLRRDLVHMCDASHHAGVHYWLVANDDFLVASNIDRIGARVAEVVAVLPIVFHSKDDFVRIYDASCMTDLDRADCRSAAPILFPDSSSGSQVRTLRQ